MEGRGEGGRDERKETREKDQCTEQSSEYEQSARDCTCCDECDQLPVLFVEHDHHRLSAGLRAQSRRANRARSKSQEPKSGRLPASGLALCSLVESLFSAFGSCLSLFATVPLHPLFRSSTSPCPPVSLWDLPACSCSPVPLHLFRTSRRSLGSPHLSRRPPKRTSPPVHSSASHPSLAHLPFASLALFAPLILLSLAEPRFDSRFPDHRTDRADCASSLQPSTSTSHSPSSISFSTRSFPSSSPLALLTSQFPPVSAFKSTRKWKPSTSDPATPSRRPSERVRTAWCEYDFHLFP